MRERCRGTTQFWHSILNNCGRDAATSSKIEALGTTNFWDLKQIGLSDAERQRLLVLAKKEADRAWRDYFKNTKKDS